MTPISMADIQRLANNETLFVELYQTEKNLQMFIVTCDGPVNVVTIDLSRHEAMESVWNLMTGLRKKHSSATSSRSPIPPQPQYWISVSKKIGLAVIAH